MNPSLAFHSPEAIRNEQERLLRKQIEYVAAHSPFYKKLFSDNHIDPQSIQSLEDLKRIPNYIKRRFRKQQRIVFSCIQLNKLLIGAPPPAPPETR
jgi:phenylacetate-CoA ligase